jgi:hypothetical protein
MYPLNRLYLTSHWHLLCRWYRQSRLYPTNPLRHLRRSFHLNPLHHSHRSFHLNLLHH